MKKTLSIILLGSLIIVACKSKKNVSKTSSNEPTEAQLTALKSKVPDGTMDDLKKGHSIFYGACTNCHGAKDVTGYSQEQLQSVIDQMAPKAKLSDSEKKDVWRYALAVNLSAKK